MSTFDGFRAPMFCRFRWSRQAGVISKKMFGGDEEARTPLFVRTKKGIGMLGRQCTRNFKLKPIRKKDA